MVRKEAVEVVEGEPQWNDVIEGEFNDTGDFHGKASWYGYFGINTPEKLENIKIIRRYNKAAINKKDIVG